MMGFPSTKIQYSDRPHSSIKAFAGENIDDILQWYEKMIVLNSDNKDLYFGKADLLWQKKHYNEAINAFDRLIAMDGEDALAWFKKGEVYSEMGRESDALECYRRTVSINPIFEEAWCRMGEILLNLDDYKEARDVFQNIVNLNPDNSNAVKVLIMLHEYFSRSEHPEDHLTWPGRKKKNLCEGDIDTELSDLFDGPSCDSGNRVDVDEHLIGTGDIIAVSKDLVSKGQVLQSEGEFIKALKYFNEALELNHLCWDAWRAKGDLFLDIGKIDEASFCYYKALYLALTPVGGELAGDDLASEDSYNQWRNSFFSSLEDVRNKLKDT